MTRRSLVVAVALLAAAACGPSDDEETSQSPEPTATTTSAATTSTTVEAAPGPTSFVAGSEEEDTTVRFDIPGGVSHTIGRGGADIRPQYAGPVGGVVYIARSLHPVQIDAIPLDGGQPATVAENGEPGGDGRRATARLHPRRGADERDDDLHPRPDDRSSA